MRKQSAGLAAVVQEEMELDPFQKALFIFCNRKRPLMKAVYWDRNGYCLWQLCEALHNCHTQNHMLFHRISMGQSQHFCTYIRSSYFISLCFECYRLHTISARNIMKSPVAIPAE